jgi:hypothetical protein
MWALLKEAIGAVPVSEIVELLQLSGSAPTADDLWVDEHLICA